AQPLGGEGLGVFAALDQFHAASLAATTSVDLGLDHPHVAANLVAGLCSLFRGVYSEALGYGQAVFSEQLLTLILVEIHACLPSSLGIAHTAQRFWRHATCDCFLNSLARLACAPASTRRRAWFLCLSASCCWRHAWHGHSPPGPLR